MTAPVGGPTVALSVVVATYNRLELLTALLDRLAGQTLPPHEFEVVVVDDGSADAVAPRLRGRTLPYALEVITQPNAGPSAARDRGIRAARGAVIVIVDDDMQIGATFLAGHLAAHPPGSRRAVLGAIHPASDESLPLFERMHMALLGKMAAAAAAGRPLTGGQLYTGNVSFRRQDYVDVGGFDRAFRLSEDAELGIRLHRAGVELVLAQEPGTYHGSDHTSLRRWMNRAVDYGAADVLVGAKHAGYAGAQPWRFLFMGHAASRPMLLASALAPALMRPVGWTAIATAMVLDRLGVERAAFAGATFVYALRYFSGVHRQLGTRRRVLASLADYLRTCDPTTLGTVGRLARSLAGGRAPGRARA